MDSFERLKVYQGFAEISRKWVTVMDAKAGFISAMNACVLAFIWTGTKLPFMEGPARILALLATISSLASLLLALCIVLPKITLKSVFGGETDSYAQDYFPVSFYGYVADSYRPEQWTQFQTRANALDEAELAKEQLEQHFTISHVLKKKSAGLTRSGIALLISVVLTGLALFAKELC